MTGHATLNTLSSLDTSVLLLGTELGGALHNADENYRARASAHIRGLGCQPVGVDRVNGEPLHVALARALDQVTTPFVVLAKDSDFLLHDALSQARQWLLSHPQVQGVQGYSLGMRPGNATVGYHRLGETAHQDGEGGLRERVLQHALSGLQPWRALLRVQQLRSALAEMAAHVEGEDGLLCLSFALLRQGAIKVLEQTMVVSECAEHAVEGDELAPTLRALRQWDAQQGGCFNDDDGFAILRQFVLTTGLTGAVPLLFTSPWASVVHEPVRSFEVRQYVELPYYNAGLFKQLTALEFLLHAWPAGPAHVRAVEGAWVRQRDLLLQHGNDNVSTLRNRYWQALSINLFAPQVCQLLLDVLTEEDEEARQELEAWIERLALAGAPDSAARLAATPSGHVLHALAAATLDDASRQRVQQHQAAGKGVSMALLVLDLADDNEALQRTFDSVASSGLRDMRIVVLKAGNLPAITTPRDTVHFVKVTAQNSVSHLNQVARQVPSDWMMLLQAGDELAGSGLLRLQLELAQDNNLKAVCGNEVQRDGEGRLVALQRPGADLDLLRSRPDAMATHWLVRREAVLQVDGYSETCRGALEFDLLLRIVETQGLGGLAHIDEFLVITSNQREAMLPDARATLERHLSLLGYRGQVGQDEAGHLHIDFRHTSTPLVSILLVGGDDLQVLGASLASIQQRTRYPRYEVLVVTQGEQRLEASLGSRVRMLACPSPVLAERLNLAASEARGEYLVLMSDRSQVSSPGWIESLLNQAQRPEVGVVGCQMHDGAGYVSHAGYELLEGGKVHAGWRGRGVGETVEALGLGVVRTCQAVSADGLMVRKEVFDAVGGLGQQAALDIDLCLRVGQQGLLVLMAPHAQLFNPAVPGVPDDAALALAAQAPWAFTRAVAVDGSHGIAVPPTAAGPRWLQALA